MTRIVARLADLGPRYRAIYCDLWGCVHDGMTPFPAAIEALRAFRAAGGTVVLVTNSPRPKAGVVAQLDTLGLPRDCYDEVATSGDCAQAAMIAGAVGRRVCHIGEEPKDDVFFAGSDIARVPMAEAEGIVVTGPRRESDVPEDYRAEFAPAVARGLTLLCANPDIIVDLGARRIFCAGALAQLYVAMGGTSLYFGKPHPPVYDLARQRLEALAGRLRDDEILCVGDGIHTDIHGGMMEGLDTLFVTEGLAAGQFGDPVALDPNLLHPWLEAEARAPTYAIGHLR